PRVASRIGAEQARVAAVLLLTLKGTPTIYYGEELGMKDVAIPFEEVRDPQGLNMPDKNLSRDPARTPMQWNDETYAGFSKTRPWLRVDRDYVRGNVDAQKNDLRSMLSLYHKLITLRQSAPALSVGEYAAVFSDTQLLSFKRHVDGFDTYLIVLNLSHRPGYFRQAQNAYTGTAAVATHPEPEGLRVGGTS